MAAALGAVAPIIWTVLAVAWLRHAIDLFRRVDPSDLPARARLRLRGDDAEPAGGWMRSPWADAPLRQQ